MNDKRLPGLTSTLLKRMLLIIITPVAFRNRARSGVLGFFYLQPREPG